MMAVERMRARHMIAVGWSRQNRASHLVTRLAPVWLLVLAFSYGPALANDFVINYAIEANGKTGSGKLEHCDDERICRFHAAELDVDIAVYADSAGVARMDMIVRGAADCCYTVDAERQFRSIVKPGLQRLAIYRRMRAARDDFVVSAFSWNKRIGTIYLELSRTRPVK
jgi:hypothetical protein